MERSGVPLFIGECAFGEEPFELAPSSSVFQFRGPDIMYQRERLVNLTIERVPDRYSKVAWVDADLLFTNPNWILETSERLDQYPLVQVFSHVLYLQPNETSYFGDGQRARGFGFSYAALPALSRLRLDVHGRTGLGWAADRNLLSGLGLYEGAVVGGADHLMAHAFTGDFSSPCLEERLGDNAGFLEHFRPWAEAMWPRVRGRVGYVPGAVLHLWHGDPANRGYKKRHRKVNELGYDPKVHLRSEPGGALTWSDRESPLALWVSEYFRGRQEDTHGNIGQR